jgi:hypothetical protein
MPTTLDKDLLRHLPREDLTVRVAPEGIYLREKHKRHWWGPLTWSRALWYCQQVQVNDAIEAKAARKVTRGLRRFT